MRRNVAAIKGTVQSLFYLLFKTPLSIHENITAALQHKKEKKDFCLMYNKGKLYIDIAKAPY